MFGVNDSLGLGVATAVARPVESLSVVAPNSPWPDAGPVAGERSVVFEHPSDGFDHVALSIGSHALAFEVAIEMEEG